MNGEEEEEEEAAVRSVFVSVRNAQPSERWVERMGLRVRAGTVTLDSLREFLVAHTPKDPVVSAPWFPTQFTNAPDPQDLTSARKLGGGEDPQDLFLTKSTLLHNTHPGPF